MTFDELTGLNPRQMASEIGELAQEDVGALIDHDSVTMITGATNASGWMLDTLEINPDSIRVYEDTIECDADVQFCGDQNEDAPFSGDMVSGSVHILLDENLGITLSDHDFSLKDEFE